MKQSKYIPGDWVKASGQLCIVEEIFVDRLTKEFEYTLVYPNGNYSRIVIGEIEPMPLTPEILEKNGWELSHGFYWSPFEEETSIGLTSQTGYVWEAYLGRCLLRSNINDVSDLQHLLFGVGVNSEMNI